MNRGRSCCRTLASVPSRLSPNQLTDSQKTTHQSMMGSLLESVRQSGDSGVLVQVRDGDLRVPPPDPGDDLGGCEASAAEVEEVVLARLDSRTDHLQPETG